MKYNHKVVLLASLIVCLIVGTLVAGCGGPSVAGVYLPSSWSAAGFRLELRSDGTYIQRVNDLDPKDYPQTILAPMEGGILRTYRGTFTVNNKHVVLNGEPAGANSFKIVGRNLSGAYGLWVRQPVTKK